MLGEEKEERSRVGRETQIGVGSEDKGAVNKGTEEKATGREGDDQREGRAGGQVLGEEGEGTGRIRGDRDIDRSAVNERWRMTTPSNPTSPRPTSRALAQQRHNQALELEKQLRALLQSKATFDPSVRALRNRICESYEAVVLEDHDFSEQHEVEQAIWRLQYKCIEEFRSRLRKITAAAAAAASAPAIPMPGAKLPPARRESSQKVLSVFKSFLSEATGFYHNLILKLRAKHGLPQDYSPFEGEPSGSSRVEKRAAELRGCDLSCHRCFIFLGDLARYKESHGDADVRSRDWSVAAGYYQQAIALWPSSGNPHNQLAVLATYVGDELLAVYRYFRSLAVESPFLTARDNLIILFEKNRNFYAQLPPQENAASSLKLDPGKPSDKNKPVRGDRILPVGDGALKLAVKDRNLEGANIGQVRKSFRIRFVRLNGILFTKTSLETFAEVYSATVCELETLLSPDDASLEAGLGSDHRIGIGTGSSGAAGFLQLVSILIFTVQNINWGHDTHHPTYAEILQRSALFQHAYTAAFECAGRLMRRCADSKDISKSPLLPAMLVYLEWLACRPEVAAGSDADDKQANARAFFWRQCITLLNRCTESSNKLHADGGLEGGALHSLSVFGDEESVGGVALWEDYELRGFVSIVPAQLTLDYSKRGPRPGLGDKKEREVRVQRLLAAGRAVANALDGTGRVIVYDEDGKTFYMVGDRREKKVDDKDVTPVVDDVSALPDRIVDEPEELAASTWLKDPSGNNSSLLSSKGAIPRREEEDEEVIVFKPMAKDSQVLLTSAPEAAWKDFAGIQTTSINSPNYGDHRGKDIAWKVSLAMQIPHVETERASVAPDGTQFVTDVPAGGPANGKGVPLSSQGTKSATFVNSTTSGIAGSLASVIPTLPNANALMNNEEVGGAKSTYGYAPSAEDWLNHMGGRTTAGFPSSSLPWDVQSVANIFGNGSEKSPSTAGVIGQQKQAVTSNSLWSTSLDSLTTVASLSNLNLGKPDYRSLRHALPHSTMPSDSLIQASKKETNGTSQAAISAPPLANGILYGGDLPRSSVRNGAVGRPPVQNPSGYAPAGKSSPFVEIQPEKPLTKQYNSTIEGSVTPPLTSSSLTTKDTAVPAARPSGMRPPPGFGPLPTKAASSNVATGTQQGSSQPEKSPRGTEGDEHQQVDDYGWLDDYSHNGHIGQAGYYQGQGSSLYSADYGIWSNGGASETVPVSKPAPATFPFPGMGVSEQEKMENQRHHQYSGQLLQQLLQQRQTYDSPRVEYGVDQSFPAAFWINNTPISAQQYESDSQQQYQVQQQQLLLLQQQQQQQQQQQEHQQQQLWYGQYRSRDPFVS